MRTWGRQPNNPAVINGEYRNALAWVIDDVTNLIIVFSAGPGSDNSITGKARLRKQFLYFSKGNPSTTFTSSTEILTQTYKKNQYLNRLLTLSQMTNSRLFKTERVCRQQFRI